MNEIIKFSSLELQNKEQTDELEKYLKNPSLPFLNLDENGKIGYTYKTLGAGFYALHSNEDFETTITKIVMEAGDSDTNGAVAGALLG